MKISKYIHTLTYAVAAAFCATCTADAAKTDQTQEKVVIDIVHPYMFGRSSTLQQLVEMVLALCNWEVKWFAFGGTKRGSRKCGIIEVKNNSKIKQSKVLILDEGQLAELGKDKTNLYEYVQNQLKDNDVAIINRLTLLSNGQPWAKTEQDIDAIKNLDGVQYHQVECNFSTCFSCGTDENLNSILAIVAPSGEMRFDRTGGKKADHSCGEKEHYITICKKCQEKYENEGKADEKILKLFDSNVEQNKPVPVEIKVTNDNNFEFVCADKRVVGNWDKLMKELLESPDGQQSRMLQYLIQICKYVGVPKCVVMAKLWILYGKIAAAQ